MQVRRRINDFTFVLALYLPNTFLLLKTSKVEANIKDKYSRILSTVRQDRARAWIQLAWILICVLGCTNIKKQLKEGKVDKFISLPFSVRLDGRLKLMEVSERSLAGPGQLPLISNRMSRFVWILALAPCRACHV